MTRFSFWLTMGICLTVLSVALVIGMFAPERRGRLLVDTDGLSEAQYIACAEVLRREEWDVDTKVVIDTSVLKDGGWIVRVSRFPLAIGGDRGVHISRDKKVLRYEVGR